LSIYLIKKYESDKVEKGKINEFAVSYVSSDAIKWYTHDSFICRILNRALRQKDMDTLCAFRCVIINIHDQLQGLCARKTNKKVVIHLYHEQSMSSEEVKRIQAHVGNFLCINSFLSTSIDRDTALIFAGPRESFEGVLFDTQIDEIPAGTKPFADITSVSYYEDEEEVLFMLDAIFRIGQVTLDTIRNIWIIQLKLCTL
jgi:hypothetical protein